MMQQRRSARSLGSTGSNRQFPRWSDRMERFPYRAPARSSREIIFEHYLKSPPKLSEFESAPLCAQAPTFKKYAVTRVQICDKLDADPIPLRVDSVRSSLRRESGARPAH